MSHKAAISFIFAVTFLVSCVTSESCPVRTEIHFKTKKGALCDFVPGAYRLTHIPLRIFNTWADLKDHTGDVYCGNEMCWFGYWCTCVEPDKDAWQGSNTVEEAFKKKYNDRVTVLDSTEVAKITKRILVTN